MVKTAERTSAWPGGGGGRTREESEQGETRRTICTTIYTCYDMNPESGLLGNSESGLLGDCENVCGAWGEREKDGRRND